MGWWRAFDAGEVRDEVRSAWLSGWTRGGDGDRHARSNLGTQFVFTGWPRAFACSDALDAVQRKSLAGR
jgi:hypothetical protein